MIFRRFLLPFSLAVAAAINSTYAQSNDNFSGALPITGIAGVAVSDSTGATREAGEPNHGGAAPGKSLWWTWTAPATSTVNFSTFGSADTGTLASSNLAPSSTLAVYSGTSLSALTEVGSSNNLSYYGAAPPAGTRSTGASFDVPVTAGTTYQIALDSAGSGNSGIVALGINQPPTIVSNATATSAVGTAFSYTIQASNHPLSFAAAGLPPGLSINPSTGIISGQPSTVGTFTATVSATNSAGTGSATVTFLVTAASSAKSLPVITSAAADYTWIGASYYYYLYATNQPSSYAVTGLPPGLAFETPSNEIVGSPTVTGTFPVSISATNAAGTSTAILTLTVASQSEAPFFTSAASASATVGQSFAYFTYVSTETMASPQTTHLSATNLPPDSP